MSAEYSNWVMTHESSDLGHDLFWFSLSSPGSVTALWSFKDVAMTPWRLKPQNGKRNFDDFRSVAFSIRWTVVVLKILLNKWSQDDSSDDGWEFKLTQKGYNWKKIIKIHKNTHPRTPTLGVNLHLAWSVSLCFKCF